MLQSAPPNPASGTQEISPRRPPEIGRSQLGKKINPRIPPKEAPPETPSICGQASGLRSRACRTTPHTAMPPPMAMPSRTRGKRARKNISASGLEAEIFCKARDRSRRTGPSSAQPITDKASRPSRTPFTQIIFLRSRTCTITFLDAAPFGFRKALGMNQAGDLFKTFADARSGPENLIGRISVDAALFYGGNGFEIAPSRGGFAALRSHAGFDDHLGSFGENVLIG